MKVFELGLKVKIKWDSTNSTSECDAVVEGVREDGCVVIKPSGWITVKGFSRSLKTY